MIDKWSIHKTKLNNMEGIVITILLLVIIMQWFINQGKQEELDAIEYKTRELQIDLDYYKALSNLKQQGNDTRDGLLESQRETIKALTDYKDSPEMVVQYPQYFQEEDKRTEGGC